MGALDHQSTCWPLTAMGVESKHYMIGDKALQLFGWADRVTQIWVDNDVTTIVLSLSELIVIIVITCQ